MLKSKFLIFCCTVGLLCHHVVAQNNKSGKTLDSLHIALQQASNTTKKIDALLLLCVHHRKIATKNLDSLSFYANKVLKLTDSLENFERQKVDALGHLAFVAYDRMDNNLAKKYLKTFKAISERIGYGTGLSNASYLSAYLSLDENDINLYLYQLENAYKIAKEYKAPEAVVFKMGIGLTSSYSVYSFNADLIAKVLLELSDLVEHPDIPLQDKATYYLDLGTLYDQTENYEKARIHFEKSVALFKKDNNYYVYAPLINLANYYQTKRTYDKAIALYNEALALKVPESYANIYFGLGTSFFYLKDYVQSELNFKKAIDEYKAVNDYAGEALCLEQIGRIYIYRNEVKQANLFFDSAIKKFHKIITFHKQNNSSKSEIPSAYSFISGIYYTKNKFKKALEYHKLYDAYNDSLKVEKNLKVSEQYALFKAKSEQDQRIKKLAFETKVQEKTAEKEQSFNRVLLFSVVFVLLLLGITVNRHYVKKKAIKTIKAKNDENKLLMREIHHRVKNNLQIILSLLGTQINNSDENELLKTILTESQNKIKSMAIIHQNLYNKNQFSKVTVSSYIKELVAHMQKSFNKGKNAIQFNFDLLKTDIKMVTAVPIGLIINELVTNAYKYAFTHKSDTANNISITFQKIKSTPKYTLIVQDNGNGLASDFEVEHSTSFGLQLVHGLVAQLHGDIEITRDNGTCFTITLEEPKET